jgi:amino acid adenylation domain-containing protein
MDPTRLETSSSALPAVDPSAECLTDGRTALNWADAIDRVARLSHLLERCGVAIGDRVGVRLAKSVDSFVAVHAVLRAGAVMVPLDPMAPAAQAIVVIEDAGVAVVIADRRSRDLELVLDATSVHSVVLPGAPADPGVVTNRTVRLFTEDDLAAATPTPESRVASPADPAYIIYTSGSTGQPKGIVHTHASALAYAEEAARHYGLHGADRFANIAPLHFDQSTFELYAAPLVGAAVLVVPDPILRFPASLSEMIARERITIWYSVPYLLEQLSTRGGLAERDLSALRWVLFGGEAFAPGQLSTLMAQLPDATFSNVYGPAEVNQCTVYDLTEAPNDSVPIGRAWAAADVRVVDPDDLTTPAVDKPGVLLVSTPTMMSHYWNRPDLTAASTITDPSGRWYVTGDLVDRNATGELVFLGRVDNQIKLRGHRIELEAIDELLRDVTGVDAGITIVRSIGDGDDVLVALVTPADSSLGAEARSLLAAEVAAELNARLPRYAVPSAVHVVAALPRTGTGKIDRGASTSFLDGILLEKQSTG